MKKGEAYIKCSTCLFDGRGHPGWMSKHLVDGSCPLCRDVCVGCGGELGGIRHISRGEVAVAFPYCRDCQPEIPAAWGDDVSGEPHLYDGPRWGTTDAD